MSKTIGIIGSGFAGLHLALLLQQQGVDVTIYTDRTTDQVRRGAPALLARWSPTVQRERELGVNFWDDKGSEFYRFNFYINGPQPLAFPGEMDQAASFVDPRVYLSRLQDAYIERGGQMVYAAVGADELVTISEAHDLTVVASGRGTMIELFPRLPQYSPFTKPARHLNLAYFDGFTSPDEDAVQFVMSPGHGEIIQGSVYSFSGLVQGILFEAVPGGDFDRLSAIRYADDPEAFNRTALELLRDHAPTLYEGIDPQHFGVRDPHDVLQGALTPVVRKGYARLSNGNFAVAVGDVHVLNDPLIAQGANTASQSAWTLGRLILEHETFDEQFCQQAETAMWDYAQHIVNWSTRMLLPPEPHVLDMIINSAQNPIVAAAFASTFNHPRQAAVLENPQDTYSLIASFAAV